MLATALAVTVSVTGADALAATINGTADGQLHGRDDDRRRRQRRRRDDRIQGLAGDDFIDGGAGTT